MNIKLLQQLVRSKKAREEEGLLVIEGDKVVQELYRAGDLVTLITDDPAYEGKKNCQVVKPEVIERISTTRSPQHCLGIARMPQPSDLKGKRWVLVLDKLQDPGNVGTLIRCAYALGWDGVFLVEPVCDLFNDKALRAARGASLKFPYRTGSIEEMVVMAKENGSDIILADVEGEEPRKAETPVWLVLGSEGQGVTKIPFKRISIPLKKGFESLNVATAGSILLYALKQS